MGFLNSAFGASLEFNNNDIILFVQRFDKGEKDQIKYSEFCNAFAPVSESFISQLSQRKPKNT